MILLTERQLCERLQVSRARLRRLRRDPRDPIPHGRVGREYRYEWPAVLEWMRGQVASPAETAEPRGSGSRPRRVPARARARGAVPPRKR